jgi:hypothetical protein
MLPIIEQLIKEWANKLLREGAIYYFGLGYAGLNCDPCDYAEFEKWYNSTHTIECTPTIYNCAKFVWESVETQPKQQ